MTQKLWSSLATAALIITTVGNATVSYANQSSSNDETLEVDVSQKKSNSEQVASNLLNADPVSETAPEAISETSNSEELPTSGASTSTPPSVEAMNNQSVEVSKVGEYQSQDEVNQEEAIAVVQPHILRGRQAVTLYVRSIPVLTFLGSNSPSADASTADPSTGTSSAQTAVKVGSTQVSDIQEAGEVLVSQQSSGASDAAQQNSASQSSNDPMWKATAIAAHINQLYLDQVNAADITVRWDDARSRYIIEANGEELVEITPDTILPDTTNDPAQDALQATNRLRRLVGDAPPLRDISGRPQSATVGSILNSIRSQFTGMASWYGPGFHGNRSANGEVFNQNGLTAAHRNLPFGTQVRVTNLSTGLSVVVRITDRGPYAHGRVIDLSAGAARLIGLMRSGVAPVRLDVLGATATASN